MKKLTIAEACVAARAIAEDAEIRRTQFFKAEAERGSWFAESTGSAADGESEVGALKAKIAGWAWSLPEHPQWQWLRQEMLDVAGTQPPNDTNSATPGS